MVSKNPLILNLTNCVTIQFVADAILAAGGAPVMSEETTDATELAGMAHAVLINIGTIHPRQETLIRTVLQSVGGKPVILDPVGCGATNIRTKISMEILESEKISLVRGNASEISALAGSASTTRGVDSTESSLSVLESAVKVAKKMQGIVVVSGEIDLITDGIRVGKSFNGTPIMTKVTGMGCAQSAFLATVLGDGISGLEAITKAVSYFGYIGEVAEVFSPGTGSFRIQFLDALSSLPFAKAEKYLKYEIGEV